MLRPATPGTLVVLAATVLLVLVTVSVPVSKSFYFLSADLSGSSNNVSLKGTLRMGCFGYCLKVASTGQDLCSSASLGYSIDAGSLLGISDNRINRAINLDGISDSVIKGLSYVLILHPIAAGFAGIATILGLVSHIREFQGSLFTSCIAGFGATFAILAFVFDIVVFSIAKSRINGNSSLQTSASLGNGVWMTLAAAILLLFSGCFFCAGRCCIRNKRRSQDQNDRMRPQGDFSYADRMRQDAEYAEKRRNEDAGRSGHGGNGTLPAFAEFGNEETRHEAIPLKSMDDDDGYEDDDRVLPFQRPQDRNSGHGAEAIGGVGMGYGRRTPANSPPPRHPSLGPRTASPPITSPASGRNMPFAAAASVPPRQNSGSGSDDPYANLPSHVEPAAAYMSPTSPRNLDDDLPHGDHDAWRHDGGAYPTYDQNRQGSLPLPGSGDRTAGYSAEPYREADVTTLSSHAGSAAPMPGSFAAASTGYGVVRSPTSEHGSDMFSTHAPTYTSRQLPNVPPSRLDNHTPGAASSAAGTNGHQQAYGGYGAGHEGGGYDKRAYPYAEADAPPSYR